MKVSEIKIQDVVYGEIVINEPLIIELVSSPSMQRLKSIDMAGYSTGYYPGCSHSRFEHSIGVYHLLTEHNASIEERVHGLLHDISHTVFSHAVDYALEGSSGAQQDFQDRVFQSFVTDSEIPQILENHGLDPDFVFDEENFPLQERQIPDLCADRLDYSLRGFFHYGILERSEINEFIRALCSSESDWYFESKEIAQKYAAAFADIDDKVYDSLTGAAMFRSVGDCIKYALKEQILTMEDLFSTDHEALTKLKNRINDDATLSRLWSKMNGEVEFVNDELDFDAVVHCKSRIVDPKFLSSSGALKKLSDEVPSWRPVVEEGLQPKTYHLKFIN